MIGGVYEDRAEVFRTVLYLKDRDDLMGSTEESGLGINHQVSHWKRVAMKPLISVSSRAQRGILC